MPHNLNKAIRFIEELYSSPISLEEIANHARISKYALIRLFNDHLQTTPIQYLTNLRIRKAAKLLHRSNKSIKQIAEEVGYADANYFNKAFRKVTGLSPGAFRLNSDFSRLVKQR